MFKSEGFILRTRNLGEADKIVTIYTKTAGKVVAVARGSRRIRNRLMGCTQVFTLGRYLIFEGKNLDTLSQGEIMTSFQSIRDDLEKMAGAMYVTELVDVFTEENGPNQEIFTLIWNTLKMIDNGEIGLALRRFELRFMQEHGYQPQLDSCINCDEELTQKIYFSREGGTVCEKCRVQMMPAKSISKGSVELAKRLLEWDSSRVSILHPSVQNLSELESCLRDYLDYRIDKPLRSLDFLQTLKTFPDPEVEKKLNGD